MYSPYNSTIYHYPTQQMLYDSETYNLPGTDPTFRYFEQPIYYSAGDTQQIQAELPQRPGMVVHAPMPMLGQNPLLSRNFEDLSGFQTLYPGSTQDRQPSYYNQLNSEPGPPLQWDELKNNQQIPGPTFPTPSELLVELSSRTDLAPSPSYNYVEVVAKDEPSPSESGSVAALPFINRPDPTEDAKSETSNRKGRRRVLNQNVGTPITDPDTISSHEKKRYYLECLEQYVMYLHQQLELINLVPLPLRRVQTYRGLQSRSIRTLLVHMENTNHKLNVKIMEEEQRFLSLREQVVNKDLLRRSSTA